MTNHTHADIGTTATAPGHARSEHDPSPADHSEHSGHGGHAGHGAHVGMVRRLFWIRLALAVPVVVASDMFAMLVGYSLPDAAWIAWTSPSSARSCSSGVDHRSSPGQSAKYVRVHRE